MQALTEFFGVGRLCPQTSGHLTKFDLGGSFIFGLEDQKHFLWFPFADVSVCPIVSGYLFSLSLLSLSLYLSFSLPCFCSFSLFSFFILPSFHFFLSCFFLFFLEKNKLKLLHLKNHVEHPLQFFGILC